MLSDIHWQAINLLFTLTPAEVAARLGIPPARLRRWMNWAPFARALKREAKLRAQATARIAQDAALVTARRVNARVRRGKLADLTKPALDLLKHSGALQPAPDDEAEAEEDGRSLSSFIREAIHRAQEKGSPG